MEAYIILFFAILIIATCIRISGCREGAKLLPFPGLGKGRIDTLSPDFSLFANQWGTLLNREKSFYGLILFCFGNLKVFCMGKYLEFQMVHFFKIGNSGKLLTTLEQGSISAYWNKLKIPFKKKHLF